MYSKNSIPREGITIPKNYGGIYFAPPRKEPIEQKVHRPPDGQTGRTLISRERGFLSPQIREEEPAPLPASSAAPPKAAPEERAVPPGKAPARPINKRDPLGEGGVRYKRGQEMAGETPPADMAKRSDATHAAPFPIDPEELLIAGLLIVLLREGTEDWLPLALALLLT